MVPRVHSRRGSSCWKIWWVRNVFRWNFHWHQRFAIWKWSFSFCSPNLLSGKQIPKITKGFFWRLGDLQIVKNQCVLHGWWVDDTDRIIYWWIIYSKMQRKQMVRGGLLSYPLGTAIVFGKGLEYTSLLSPQYSEEFNLYMIYIKMNTYINKYKTIWLLSLRLPSLQSGSAENHLPLRLRKSRRPSKVLRQGE